MELYFPQIITTWNDWIEVINIGSGEARINIIGRNYNGKLIWKQESALFPLNSHIITLNDVDENDISLQIISDQPLVGQRYIYSESGVTILLGASEQTKTVGKKYFLLSELLPDTVDWFRFLNVGEVDSKLYFVFRTNKGEFITDRDFFLAPFCWWDVGQEERNIGGDTNFEVVSSQPLIIERHIYYRSKGGQKMMNAYICQSVDWY